MGGGEREKYVLFPSQTLVETPFSQVFHWELCEKAPTLFCHLVPEWFLLIILHPPSIPVDRVLLSTSLGEPKV